MEYFFYCRDKPGTSELRKKIVETHWSFMDHYVPHMIARGPTLGDDWSTQTGSMHIVDLPNSEAAQVFAFDEPYYKAGVYSEVLVRRWRNVLGGTMWEFKGDPDRNRRFLIIGQGRPDVSDPRGELLEAHRRYYVDRGYLKHFIERGPLLSDDGKKWLGSAMLIEMPDRAAVEGMLADEPYVRAGLYEKIEIHNWRFGGRR